MSDSRHTPGPWVWANFGDDVCLGGRSAIDPEEDGPFQGLYCPAERRVVAVAQDASAYTASFIDPDSANAHLIAAAPPLYEACELSERALDLRRQLESRALGDHATLDPWTVERAEIAALKAVRAALAQARGEVS